MTFETATAIKIARQLRDQNETKGLVNADIIEDQEPQLRHRALIDHLNKMEDAGWIADVERWGQGYPCRARLTYQGETWLTQFDTQTD